MRGVAIALALSAAVSAGPVQTVLDGFRASVAGVSGEIADVFTEAPARSFWPP